VEESTLTQTEEEPISGLCAGTVGAPATTEYSLPVIRRNGDTPMGYSGGIALRTEQCGSAESLNRLSRTDVCY
jgi:hypothetical protein